MNSVSLLWGKESQGWGRHAQPIRAMNKANVNCCRPVRVKAEPEVVNHEAAEGEGVKC